MLLTMAVASDFGRQDESLRVTRYKRLEGEGPVVGRWRNRSGDFLATRFADGQIEHVDVFEGKTLKQTRLFGADGRPEATVDWIADAAVVHFAPPVTVPLVDWISVELAGLALRLPPGMTESGSRWTAEHLVVALEPAADPFAQTYADELVAGCGCELEARRTLWLAGRPAAHFRLYQLGPEGRTADVIALPGSSGLLLLSSSGETTADLAPLRAIVATAREAP